MPSFRHFRLNIVFVVAKREKEAAEKIRTPIVALAREKDCLQNESEPNVESWSEWIESGL